MINYETYQFIHLICVLLFVMALSLSLWGIKEKSLKILLGVTTFFILVSGMGLIARLGFSHAEPFPFWIWGKMAIWGILGIGGPIIVKRKPELSKIFWFLMIALLSIQIYFVTFKPGA